MRQVSLSTVVKRHFVHCISARGMSVAHVVDKVGLPPGELCQVIAGQNINRLPLNTYYQIARWLQMPLVNVVSLAGIKPSLPDLVQFGMEARGYRATSVEDQLKAASEAGIGVAVFRRALHGYMDFKPSLRTCDSLTAWLAWTGFAPDDIAQAAGMAVRYLPNGRCVTLSLDATLCTEPYPCACGRVGCMVPAHIPCGPQRKWRNDACRMWAKRKTERERCLPDPRAGAAASLPHSSPIVRFIMINERQVPARF